MSEHLIDPDRLADYAREAVDTAPPVPARQADRIVTAWTTTTSVTERAAA